LAFQSTAHKDQRIDLPTEQIFDSPGAISDQRFTASLSRIGVQRHHQSGANRGEWRGHTFSFERFVEEVAAFVERKDLSRKILRDNPKRLYGYLTLRETKKPNLRIL
jgi:hypothetical protein